MAMDEVFAANKAAMSEFAGEDAVGFVTFAGEQVNENKYGADHFETIESMRNPGDPSSTYKVYDVSDEKLTKPGKFVASAGVLMNGVNIGMKIKELVELIKEPDSDDQFLRIFKYVMIGLEIMDNLIQGASGVMTLVKNANVDLPFVAVLLAAGQFGEAIYNFIQANLEYKKEKTLELELEKDMMFWDAFDSGFGLIQAIVDCVLKLITLASAGISTGVTTAIGLAVKALVSVSSLFFAGMKLRKVKQIKDRLVDYMTTKTAEFKDEVHRNRNILIKEKCSQFSTLLINMVQSELVDLEKNMMKSSASLKNVTKELSPVEKTQLEADVVKFNKGMLTMICTEDNEFCPEFLDSLRIDLGFINTDTEVQEMLKNVAGKESFAPINSMVAVYKGMQRTEAEVKYTLFLTTRLLSSDYDILAQTPRYDIYVCRGCGDQRLKLSGLRSFQAGNKVEELKASQEDGHLNIEEVQDTVQFVNTEKKSEEEITEYLVAGYSTKSSSPPNVFTEVHLDFQTENAHPHQFSLKIEEHDSNFDKNEMWYAILITWDLHLIKNLINARQQNPINILSSMVHQDSKDKKTYVLLLALPNGKESNKYLPWSFRQSVRLIKVLVPIHKEVYRKFSVIVSGDGGYPGINQELMEKSGWTYEMTLRTEFKEGDEEREQLEFLIFWKPVIKFNWFPISKSNLDILSDIERIKGSKMGEIYSYLHSVTCGDECKNAHLTMPNITYATGTGTAKKKVEKKICEMSEPDWSDVLKASVEKTKKHQGCIWNQYCSSYKNFWNNGVLNLIKTKTLNGHMDGCPHDQIACKTLNKH